MQEEKREKSRCWKQKRANRKYRKEKRGIGQWKQKRNKKEIQKGK
jgi:hypothetical protein